MDPETTVQDAVTEAPEETSEEVKTFSEMTDDERMKLSDEELAKALDEEPEQEEQSSDDDDDGTPTEEVEETGEEDDESFEEKTDSQKRDEVESDYDKISKMGEEEFNALPKDKKGIFFEMRSERNKRQDLERELEKERAIREGQLKVIENLKQFRPENGEGAQQFKSEYDRVMADIEAKAQVYEDETGEEYRLTLKDQRALQSAQQKDAETLRQQNEKQMQEKQHQETMQTFQSRIDQGIATLKETGIEDFDHVYKNYIEPHINPEIARDPDEAKANAAILINLAMKGKNPAKYAYEHFARLTPEGQKYFREREQKQLNKKIVKEGSKRTTTTSAHVDGSRSTNGKTKVDMTALNSNFDYYAGKLTDEQFTKVVSGGVVHI